MIYMSFLIRFLTSYSSDHAICQPLFNLKSYWNMIVESEHTIIIIAAIMTIVAGVITILIFLKKVVWWLLKMISGWIAEYRSNKVLPIFLDWIVGQSLKVANPTIIVDFNELEIVCPKTWWGRYVFRSIDMKIRHQVFEKLLLGPLGKSDDKYIFDKSKNINLIFSHGRTNATT